MTVTWDEIDKAFDIILKTGDYSDSHELFRRLMDDDRLSDDLPKALMAVVSHFNLVGYSHRMLLEILSRELRKASGTEVKPRNKNFETALKALIEHHGADALSSLAAVMRHYNIEFQTVGGLTIAYSDAGIVFDMDKSEITANDIKPEK